MRTKTLLLSTLLGALGSVAVHAQSTNVYSLNAVGYINVTLLPGFNIISCPLYTSPDQTLGSILPNTTNAGSLYDGDELFFLAPGATSYTFTSGQKVGTSGTGWTGGASSNIINPGTAFWFENNSGSNLTVTFVGTVPTGLVTNALAPGFNLVSSVVPIGGTNLATNGTGGVYVTGDIYSNTISAFTNSPSGDEAFIYSPAISNYAGTYATRGTNIAHNGGSPWTLGSGFSGDPIIPNVGEGFFYENNSGATEDWVEDYSVSE